MFPEYGDTFPVWRKGVGVLGGLRLRGTLQPTVPVATFPGLSGPLSAGLRAELQEWNDEWERRGASGEDVTDPRWRAGWVTRGQRLAAQLASETGAEVVLLWPELDGRDESCPNCATRPWQSDGSQSPAVSWSRLDELRR